MAAYGFREGRKGRRSSWLTPSGKLRRVVETSRGRGRWGKDRTKYPDRGAEGSRPGRTVFPEECTETARWCGADVRPHSAAPRPGQTVGNSEFPSPSRRAAVRSGGVGGS